MDTSFFDAFNRQNKICLRFYIALFVTIMLCVDWEIIKQRSLYFYI